MQAKRDLETLQRTKEPNQEAIDAAQAKLQATTTARKARENELIAEIDAYSFEKSNVQRTVFAITVGGGGDAVEIRLRDHIDAYSSANELGVVGRARGDSDALVTKTIDAQDGLSDSKRKILKATSGHEGTFSELNGYDSAGLTWGFIQMTGGEHSSLTQMLTDMKEVAPEAFAKRFQAYGIDIAKGRIVVTRPDGSLIRGEAAAQAICQDPELSAVMVAAGMDPEIQRAEIHAASRKMNAHLDKKLAVDVEVAHGMHVKGIVKVGDVLTSEYGAGLYFDISVHAGPGSAETFFRASLKEYVVAHPDVDLGEPSKWAKDVEAAVVAKMRRHDERRAADLERQNASREPGSFTR